VGGAASFDAAPGEMTFARLGLWNDKVNMGIVRAIYKV